MEASSNIGAVQTQLRSLANEIQSGQGLLIERALDDLIAQLQPATPVRTGRMRAGYTASVQGNVGELGNVMDYAKFVAFGTSRMHANANLVDVLDSAEKDIADTYGLALTRLVARYR